MTTLTMIHLMIQILKNQENLLRKGNDVASADTRPEAIRRIRETQELLTKIHGEK